MRLNFIFKVFFIYAIFKIKIPVLFKHIMDQTFHSQKRLAQVKKLYMCNMCFRKTTIPTLFLPKIKTHYGGGGVQILIKTIIVKI